MTNLPPNGPSGGADGLRARLEESIDEAMSSRRRSVLIALAVVAGFALWAFTSEGLSSEPVENQLPRVADGSTPSTASAPSSSGPQQDLMVVQVAGAVERPGVYRLPEGARVVDAVDEAGGTAPDADLDRINLAAKVTDGQRVYVVRVNQPAPPQEAQSPASVTATGAGSAPGEAPVVDLNTATATELDSLPGVGPATAQAILTYRNANGPFRSVDDLGKVKGIGPAKLAELRDRVRVQ